MPFFFASSASGLSFRIGENGMARARFESFGLAACDFLDFFADFIVKLYIYDFESQHTHPGSGRTHCRKLVLTQRTILIYLGYEDTGDDETNFRVQG